MANVAQIDDQSTPKDKTPTGWHQFWQSQKTAADKRLRHFTRQGNQVTKRFLDEREDANDIGRSEGGVRSRLNLFWKNITTQQAMLYGSTPRIDVSREFHDPDDDIARVAATLFQRLLQSDMEASGEDLPTALKAALQDRLLPGLGVCRVRYDMGTTTASSLNPETMEMEEVEQLDFENAPVDYVHWQDFLWGWGRTWSEIPWMGFRSWLTKQEAADRFGAKAANNLEYKNQLPSGDDEENINSEEKNNVQKAEIWEFWDKGEKRVFWFSAGADIILDVQDDPLDLMGFWPVPRPMAANLTTTIFTPRADYLFAQDLYNEIDVLQSRIAAITRAIKVVGVYDKGAGESVGRMLQEGTENQLIPVDNWAMFSEKGGLQGSMQWFPVQEVAQTLQILQEIQSNKIAQLNEITGMSEIMRGAAGGQYTAASSNQLAAKMGSIYIQAVQDEFARFASDLEALKAEIISKHFAPQSILMQSNAQFMPEADKDKVMPAVELMQSPDVKWRIDIRPESIAMIDYAQLKQERTEFLTSMATYVQSAQAAVKAVPGSLPILLELMKWGMAGFKGSDYLEGTMDQAIDMAKKAPPEDQDKGQKEAMQMQMQMEMQKIQAKSQADMQAIQAKSQAELQKIQMDNQANMSEFQAKGQADLQKITADLQADMRIIASKLDADLQREEAQSTMAIAEAEVDHANALIEEDQDHINQMDQIRAQGKSRDTDGED